MRANIRRPYVPRFNRRARLADMLGQILAAAVATIPRPHATITQAYAAGAK
jgi:hypothetical protein